MVTGGFEWLLVVKGGYWVVRGGYEWSHVVSGGFVVVGGNGWVVVFRAACTRASAKFILDRLEKARLNYLLVLEENMRLTSL